MAVKIRLTKLGKKKEPYYRIVVVDAREARDGPYIEQVGFYNPRRDPEEVRFNEERLLYWISVGAIPTPTVRRLIMRYTKVPVPPRKGEPRWKRERFRQWVKAALAGEPFDPSGAGQGAAQPAPEQEAAPQAANQK